MPSRKQGITGLSQRQRTFSESGVNGVALTRLGKPWRHGGATEPGPAERTAHAEKRHRKTTRSPRGPASGFLGVSFLHLQTLIHLLCARHWRGSRGQRDVKT